MRFSFSVVATSGLAVVSAGPLVELWTIEDSFMIPYWSKGSLDPGSVNSAVLPHQRYPNNIFIHKIKQVLKKELR